MSQHTKNEVRAGAVIVAGFLLLCFSIYVVADFKTWFAPKTTHYFSFDRVEGLKVDDDVLYAGIKAGRVTDIAFQRFDDASKVGDSLTRILVTVVVDAKVPLTDGDRPRISRGFTGSVQLDIAPWQRRKDDVRVAQPLVTTREKPLLGSHYASLSEVADEAKSTIVQFRGELSKVGNALDNISAASADVKRITGEVRAMVERNVDKIDGMVANADQTVANAKDASGTLKTDAEAFMKVANETIRKADDAVGKAKAKIEEILPSFTDIVAKIKNSAANVEDATVLVKGTAVKVDAAADDVKVATANVRDIVVANRPNIDGTLQQLRESAGRLNLAMEDVRRNPWKLLSRNVESDAYTQNIYDASLSFADGARSLAQSSATLNALASQPNVDRESVRRQTEKLNQLVTEMTKLEQALYEAMKQRPR